MPNFDSGVKEYIFAEAVVRVGFPVDYSGKADINCMQCQFFSRNNGMCQLTKEIVAYPAKYVGGSCPLEEVEK